MQRSGVARWGCSGGRGCRVVHDAGLRGVGREGRNLGGVPGTGGRATHVGIVVDEYRPGARANVERGSSVWVAAVPSSSSGKSSSSPTSPSASSSSSKPRPSLRPHVVIIVEGINDARNVGRYLDVDIYVLGSATKTATSATQEALRGLQGKYRRIVLLLDPDVAGRQARNDIDRLLNGKQCWHAFIPTIRATLDRQTKYKEVGDVGVEHASGEAVRQAVLRSRLSRSGGSSGEGGLPFDRGMLIELGLVAEMGVRGGDVTRRRELVCAWLGIGMCDGKQLLRQLNAYGFTLEDLNDALAYANANLG